MNAFASFETNNATRYLSMLCDHFGTRVKAHRTAKEGWVQFPFGRCDMTAENTQLEFIAMADDQPQLDQVVQIVTNHFERFAFRENPHLDWRKTSN